jgi:5-methylcytosine-specific restriction endonuclease McrA
LLKQGAKVACPRCDEPMMLGHVIEREHFHELALGGTDEPENCFYSHQHCHALVTNGSPATSAGSSKHKIAKAKRIAKKQRGEQKLKRKIPSRPFPKRKQAVDEKHG